MASMHRSLSPPLVLPLVDGGATAGAFEDALRLFALRFSHVLLHLQLVGHDGQFSLSIHPLHQLGVFRLSLSIRQL